MKFDIEFTTEEKIDITTAYAQFLVNRGERGDEPRREEVELLFTGARGVVDEVMMHGWGPTDSSERRADAEDTELYDTVGVDKP